MKAAPQDRFTFPVTTRPVPATTPASRVGSGSRIDGRGREEFRRVQVRCGVVSQAAGSSFVELGRTKVVCSVFGPRQKAKMQVSEEGRVSCALSFAPFTRRSRSSSLPIRHNQSEADDDSGERELALVVAHSIETSMRLEAIPKSIVDLNVLVLEDDGGVAAAAMAGCSVALADAGIEMWDLVAACSVARVNDELVVDPTAEEEERADGGLVVSLMPSLNEITQLYQFGELSQADLSQATTLCLDGCSTVYDFMRSTLVSSVAGRTAAQTNSV